MDRLLLARDKMFTFCLAFMVLAIFVSVIPVRSLMGQEFNMGSDATLGDYGWFQGNVTTIDLNTGAAAPFDGRMVRWRLNNAFNGGQAIMKVFRESGGYYVLVAEDSRTITAGSGLNVFQVDIPVQQGDLLGIYCSVPDLVMCRTGGSLALHAGNTGTSPQSEWEPQSYTLSVDALVEAVGIEELPKGLPPQNSFELFQNYPNPFNTSTSIRYNLPGSGNVEISIYNAQGQPIRTLLTGRQQAGTHTVIWDGRDNNGRLLPSGVYFCQLKLGDKFSQTKKLLLLRPRP